MQLKGHFERIIYQKTSNGYTVGIFIPTFPVGSSEVTVTGYFGNIKQDRLYIIDGEYIDHPNYGIQFKCDSFSFEIQNDREGLINYFSGENFKGIGKKYAAVIVDYLKEDAVNKIMMNNDILDEIPKMNKKRKEAIIEGINLDKDDETTFLLGHHLTMSDVVHLRNTYKDQLMNKLFDDPYQIIYDVDSISFSKADKFALSIGIKSDNFYRLAAFSCTLLMELCMKNGDSYCLYDQFYTYLNNKLKDYDCEIENIIDEMDYDELFERNEDFVDEAYNATTVSYAFKILPTMFSNMFKAKKDINQIQPGLLKMVERCKTIQDIDALNKDLNVGLKQVKNMNDNCKDPEKKKQYEQHLKWLQTTYRDAIKAKKKELKNAKKAVKEAAILALEDCINEIDNKISKHTDAEEFASNEVYVTENYKTYVIPIMKKSDTTLSGLKLPYKMKAVLESIINTIDNYDKCENIKAIKKVIDTNKSNVSAILEEYKGIPSTPLYKVNYFNTFNDLINILDNKVDEILETYDNIEFDDYIYENGVGLYYDEDTFNIITESVNDEFNPDEVNAIDMDYILADTIAKYTLMETMYTIKLEDYNYDSIRKMTNNMLNK